MSKRLFFVIAIAVLTVGAVPAFALPVKAAIYSPSVEAYCLPITVPAIETYKNWLSRMSPLNRSFCKVVDTTPLKSYNFLLQKSKDKSSAADLSEFDKRINSCIGNDTSTLNPKNWGKVISCNFKVAFFPTSKVIVNNWGGLRDTLNSHQPTAYMGVGLRTINGISTNWGSSSFCAATGTNSISFGVQLPQIANSWDMRIPCQPPQALRVLRTFSVAALWIGFAFWIYFLAVGFWNRRQG